MGSKVVCGGQRTLVSFISHLYVEIVDVVMLFHSWSPGSSTSPICHLLCVKVTDISSVVDGV